MATTYDYTISGDFTSGLSLDWLNTQIIDSSISIALQDITRRSNDVAITFLTALSAPELATLNALILAHEPPTPISSTFTFENSNAYITNNLTDRLLLTITTDYLVAGNYKLKLSALHSNSMWFYATNLRVTFDGSTLVDDELRLFQRGWTTYYTLKTLPEFTELRQHTIEIYMRTQRRFNQATLKNISCTLTQD